MLHQLLAAVQPQITALAGKDVLVAHCPPVQHSHELPWEPVLSTCRSRCQQTSVALHGLLEGEPCLEGYVAHIAPVLCSTYCSCAPSTWPGQVCLAVVWRYCQGHTPPRCVWLDRTFFHSGCTGSRSRAGGGMAGDLVPPEVSPLQKAFPQVLQVKNDGQSWRDKEIIA